MIGKAYISKVNAQGNVFVCLDILPAEFFQMNCKPLMQSKMIITDGTVVDPEAMCISGVRYAKNIFPLSNSLIVILTVTGIVESQNLDAISIATVLAIGDALGREDLIPKTIFSGYNGCWEKCFIDDDKGDIFDNPI